MSNVIQFEEAIKQSGPRFTRMRTNHEIKFATECMFALQLFRANTRLTQCTEASVREALLDLAAVGLSLNPAMRHAYLIPRKRKIGIENNKPVYEINCCLSISYIGQKHIAEESGAVKTVWADVIFENDEWEYESGSEPKLIHKPNLTEDRGERVSAYAVAILHDGTKHITMVPRKKVEQCREFSENPSGQYSPWTNWTDDMWKKTAVNQGAKYWPRTPRFAKAIDVATRADGLLTEPPKVETLTRIQTADIRAMLLHGGVPKAQLTTKMKLLARSLGFSTASQIPQPQFEAAKAKAELHVEKLKQKKGKK